MDSLPNLYLLSNHKKKYFTSFHKITKIEGGPPPLKNEDIKAQRTMWLRQFIQSKRREEWSLPDSSMVKNKKRKIDLDNPQPLQTEKEYDRAYVREAWGPGCQLVAVYQSQPMTTEYIIYLDRPIKVQVTPHISQNKYEHRESSNCPYPWLSYHDNP